MTIVMIYTTFPTKSEAKKIGRELVARKLAACVNIFPRMTAIFEWEGEIQEGRETAMIIKTVETRRDAVYELLKSMHSYTTPAFLVYSASAGSESFAAWVEAQTAV